MRFKTISTGAGARACDRRRCGDGPLHHARALRRNAQADGIDDGVGAEAVGELLDLRDPFIATLLDDVGGAVEPGQLLSLWVAGHGDDALCTELLGREDRHQPDRAVTDHGDGLARAGLRGVGGEPAGAEHVRSRQE